MNIYHDQRKTLFFFYLKTSSKLNNLVCDFNTIIDIMILPMTKNKISSAFHHHSSFWCLHLRFTRINPNVIFFSITSITYLRIILVHHDGTAWYLVLFVILVFSLNWYQSFCIHQWMGYSCNGQIPSDSEAPNLCILCNPQYLNTENNETKKI